MLDMILNNHFEEPYNKFPPDGPVPILSKSLVKVRLTSKFAEITDQELMNNYNKFTNNVENGKIFN
jgi:hypothetical protein